MAEGQVKIGRGNCFNCGKSVGKGMYCYGCKSFVCDDCDVALGSLPIGVGNHTKEDHLASPEEPDDV